MPVIWKHVDLGLSFRIETTFWLSANNEDIYSHITCPDDLWVLEAPWYIWGWVYLWPVEEGLVTGGGVWVFAISLIVEPGSQYPGCFCYVFLVTITTRHTVHKTTLFLFLMYIQHYHLELCFNFYPRFHRPTYIHNPNIKFKLSLMNNFQHCTLWYHVIQCHTAGVSSLSTHIAKWMKSTN